MTGERERESDDNDEVHYSWRGAGGGREMEERAVAAEVRRGQLGVTRDRAVRVQQPANTIEDISHGVWWWWWWWWWYDTITKNIHRFMFCVPLRIETWTL